jgi:predicted ATPase/DNA-binding winged helix-turn-helix (wHTH) protein
MSTAVLSDQPVFAFGSFELDAARRTLLNSGTPVRLGSRAFEILLTLVEHADEVVSKRELIARAWPGLFVEQSNLRVHIAVLRKILRDAHMPSRYIRSVNGRGYCFVAPVARRGSTRGTAPRSVDAPLRLPAALNRLVGRTSAVEDIVRRLGERRLVTVVGPGGIGKSTVALAAAEQLAARHARKVCLAELSVIDDPRHVPTSLATAIGISVLTSDPVSSLIAYLRDVRMLLVLDNCEHVIEGVAPVVERVIADATPVDVLVTSREPLLVKEESIYRLTALPGPPLQDSLSAEEARRYPAVELFVERATGSFEDFTLTDENALDVAAVCARLDGIPFAIELAAARVGLLGVRGLLSQVDGRLMLLSKGRRTAQPRHQSLRAMLDWSYQTLAPHEQTILRRVSVFRRPFSARSAADVASAPDLPADTVEDGLITLAGKSLLNTELDDGTIRYRMLQTTRMYAFEKLEGEPAELATILRRHAAHHCSVLTHAQAEWESLTRPQWLEKYSCFFDDVRAALDWAFSPGGDVELGVSLTVTSLPFGFHLAQIDEFMRRAERALDARSRLSPAQPVVELRLATALAVLRWNTGAADDLVTAAFIRVAELADRIGVAKLKVGPLTSQAVFELELGNYSAAVAACEALARVAEASGDPLAVLLAERAAAQAYHFAADHERSRALAQRVLRHPARAIPLAYGQASVDKGVSMRIILARVFWLEGRPDQALQVIEESLSLASSDGPFAMCQALALGACPIALWRGDAVAQQRITELLQFSTRYTLMRWHALGVCFQGTSAAAEPVIAPGSTMQRDLLATVSERWVDAATIARARSNRRSWCAPEVLRTAAEIDLRKRGSAARVDAQGHFTEAIEWARAQQALAWELRAATSLARLLNSVGQPDEARACLEPVYARFDEGHETKDLRAAAHLLEQMAA